MTERELEGQVALVTGGGRGIGADIARELSSAGARVAVSARTREQVDEIAREIGGLAVVGDVSERASVDAMVQQVESELGPIDLLVANAGRNVHEQRAWEVDPADWWNVFEVNVRGVYLCSRAVIPGMLERGRGRIVITGSGAAYLPHSGSTAYSSSKAAVWRFGNVLADQLEGRIAVFVISPGLVRTEMTKAAPDDAPWTPPELAPRLVRVPRGCADRPLPPRRARRHRGSDPARRRDSRARSERDPPAAMSRRPHRPSRRGLVAASQATPQPGFRLVV